MGNWKFLTWIFRQDLFLFFQLHFFYFHYLEVRITPIFDLILKFFLKSKQITIGRKMRSIIGLKEIDSVHFFYLHSSVVQGKAQRLDFVPFEQCFLRRHSRRKTNVFLKSPHLNLARKDFKEANWVILSQLIPYQLRAHNRIWVEVLLTF